MLFRKNHEPELQPADAAAAAGNHSAEAALQGAPSEQNSADLKDLSVKDYFFETSPMVCSNAMMFDIDHGRLSNLRVVGGCNGNLQGISRLTEGMPVDEIVNRLGGIQCGGRPDSCPNQLATALRQCLAENGYEA